jgi:hypothetical protein
VFTIEIGLPIQLASFTGRSVQNTVVLDWMTLSEINNYGFEVQLSPDDSAQYTTLPNSFVQGHGTTNEPRVYTFVVNNPPPRAHYRLKQTDLDGTVWYSEAIVVTSISTSVANGEMPEEFGLFQNYPNPFNPSTTIGFGVSAPGHVYVEVFNILGECVANLVNERLEPGRYRVEFNAGSIPSGLYFYRMKTKSYTAVRRMLLIK